MKKIQIVLVLLVYTITYSLWAQETTYFGDTFSIDGSLTRSEMSQQFEQLQPAATYQSKFKATVGDVCSVKGCWMTLQLDNGKEALVKFKDYGFFMPRDIIGKQVIVNGFAFVEEMSIEDQKHYASDAGKSKEEIAKIVDTKRTYSFEADGVLILK